MRLKALAGHSYAPWYFNCHNFQEKLGIRLQENTDISFFFFLMLKKLYVRTSCNKLSLYLVLVYVAPDSNPLKSDFMNLFAPT